MCLCVCEGGGKVCLCVCVRREGRRGKQGGGGNRRMLVWVEIVVTEILTKYESVKQTAFHCSRNHTDFI